MVDLQSPEPGRRNTNDFEGVAIQTNRLSDDRFVIDKLALPKAVADDGDWACGTASMAVVGSSEHPAPERRHTQNAEKVATHP